MQLVRFRRSCGGYLYIKMNAFVPASHLDGCTINIDTGFTRELPFRWYLPMDITQRKDKTTLGVLQANIVFMLASLKLRGENGAVV